MDKNNGSPVLNLLTGAAIGAALGLLFAPDKGEETRKVIVKTARKYAEPIIDRVGQSIEDVYDWGGEIYDKSVKPEKKDNTGSILLTLLLAVPVGAALGVLFAPAKGSETRKKIVDAASQGLNSISSAIPGNIFGGEEAGQNGNSTGSKKSSEKYAM